MNIRHHESDDYCATLTRTTELMAALSDAYKRRDYEAAHDLHKEVGNLYAPSESIAAEMIAYIVEIAFRRGWFDGQRAQDAERFAS